MEKPETFIDSIYLDPRIDAGEPLPGGFEPDLSFFADENFRKMTDDERTIFKLYDMSTIYQKQFACGFGGVHSYNPKSELFGNTETALNYFIELVGDEPERAICIVEGEARVVNLAHKDEDIFALHGEVGRAELIARRAGIRVVGAEPLIGLDYLAREYGSVEVLNYLSLRVLPQWYQLDPKLCPSPNAYIVSIFRTRPYLSLLRHLGRADSYVHSLEHRMSFTLPYGMDMPGVQECLEQTTYEYIVTIPEEQRTITQQIAFKHNLQRNRRLYSDIKRYLSQGMHVCYVYGDVHLRALDKTLSSDADNMRIGRKSAERQFRFPPSAL